MNKKIFIVFILSVIFMMGCAGFQKEPETINAKKSESQLFFEALNDSLLYKDGTIALSSLCLSSQNKKEVTVDVLKRFLNIPNIPLEKIPEGAPKTTYSVEFLAEKEHYTEISSRLFMLGHRYTQYIKVYHEPSSIHSKFCIRVPDEIIGNQKEEIVQQKTKKDQGIPKETKKEKTEKETVLEEIDGLPNESQMQIQKQIKSFIINDLNIDEEDFNKMSEKEKNKIEEQLLEKIKDIMPPQ